MLLEDRAPDCPRRWKDPSPGWKTFRERPPVRKFRREYLIGKLFPSASPAVKDDGGVSMLLLWLDDVRVAKRTFCGCIRGLAVTHDWSRQAGSSAKG